MKSKTTLILIALLVSLGMLLASSASSVSAKPERPGSYWFPCCKKTGDGRPYCCQNCCFFRWDCMADKHCL